MKVIDTHVHFWDIDAVPVPWLTPAGEAYSGDNRKLPTRYTDVELLAGAGDVDVLKIVNVEAKSGDPLAETRWLQHLAERAGHPDAIVAMVDLSAADAAEQLAQHARSPNLRGIRQILNVHADPVYDYVGRHYMAEPQWRANLSALAAHGLSFDLQIYPSQAALAAELAAENADIMFILNHAGMCVDRHRAGWREWREGLRRLAAQRNVVTKISGLAMFDHHWTIESLRPYVLETIEAFGPERCMFASNFPVDGLHAGYAATWHAYAEIVADASGAERDAMFVGNAERYYRI
ncbi:amidohydrolase family protein [Solimonas marina]|uniref:Amidohydrolase family protein n=1 Tax=Solimonas marina TaxID=2714601 RepID=A0A970B7S9_9GAMM|nr:amidohydrolase family protein [Solimonas marina]